MKFQNIISTIIMATAAPSTFAAPAGAGVTPRGDPIMGKATCGVKGKPKYLPHDDLVKRVEEFAAWVDHGANGLVDPAGRFHGKLSYNSDSVTLFACDYKSKNKGSIITGQLIRLALGNEGYLDGKCGQDNAGYERSNDLSIGRTFYGDHFC